MPLDRPGGQTIRKDDNYIIGCGPRRPLERCPRIVAQNAPEIGTLDVGLAVSGCAVQKNPLPAAIDQCKTQRVHVECAVYGVSRPRMCKLKIEESARGGARARTPESYARRCVARQRTPWIFVTGTR